MRRSLTYPKDGDRLLRETIRQLKTQVSRLRKENDVLRSEIDNIMKPERPRREHVEQRSPKVMTQDEWRKNFISQFKPTLQKRLKEIDNDGEDQN